MNTTRFLLLSAALACRAAAFAASADAGKAPAADFREETIYFVMTDRFADGDPANNDLYGDEYRPGDLKYYQGGDFKGLIDNLGYIKDMGFSAVWITPPVMQPPGRYQSLDGGYDAAGYHGYWAWDFSRIDPHLESEGASYRDLIAAAHARGLKVIQDVVTNHGHGGYVSPSVKWYAGRGRLSGLGLTFDYYDDKSAWFNHGGPAIADLLDLNDNNPEVLKWFLGIYKGYQDLGVDAFRIDTVAWMRPEFWKEFTAGLHANKKDFFLFGEAWTNSDFSWLGSYTRLAAGDPMNAGMSVVDMPLSSMGGWGRLEPVFKGGDYRLAEELLKSDTNYQDPTWLVTYLDNHDKPRFNGPGRDGSAATTEQYFDALNFYFTARGIPCVYYGTEVQMAGGNDPDNRKVLGPGGIKRARRDPVYHHLRKLNAVRRASPALQKGKHSPLYADREQLAFKREHAGDAAYVLLNKGGAPALMGGGHVPPGRYTELYTGQAVELGKKEGVEVPPHGLRVLAKGAAGEPWNLPGGPETYKPAPPPPGGK
ncbi:MAG: alpha-amylase family glycosyl hydrolase [Elusimicrobiales bacterium]